MSMNGRFGEIEISPGKENRWNEVARMPANVAFVSVDVGVANVTKAMPTDPTPAPYQPEDITYWIAVTPESVAVPERKHIRDPGTILTTLEPTAFHTNWSLNAGDRVWVMTNKPGLSAYVDGCSEPG